MKKYTLSDINISDLTFKKFIFRLNIYDHVYQNFSEAMQALSLVYAHKEKSFGIRVFKNIELNKLYVKDNFYQWGYDKEHNGFIISLRRDCDLIEQISFPIPGEMIKRIALENNKEIIYDIPFFKNNTPLIKFNHYLAIHI